ncbi:MAG: peptidylprolyl isomerase [Bacteroidota bacterium]
MRIFFIAAFFCLSLGVKGQIVDRILAVVGEDVILLSDVDAQYAYFMANGQKDDGTLRCQLLEKLIIEKLLLNKAKQDSVEVSDDQVEGELQRKLDYFIQGYGGVEKVEAIYQKPLIEIRADLRPDIKDQLLIDRMRQIIVAEATITPREVKKFYNQIPKDSLPFLPAEVEVFQIVKQPTASATADREAKSFLASLKTKIESGDVAFEEAARKYSVDFGSARTGGLLPEFSRGRMVPEFEEMAFKINEGTISPVFKTDFGYHILKLEKRVGEIITARHILVAPKVTMDDDSTAVRRLREIREMITSADTLDFETAAQRFSDDIQTAPTGGSIKNPQTGEMRIPLDMLDGDLYLTVDEMDIGEVTNALEYFQPDNKKSFRLLYLKRRVPPHVANLKSDYRKLHEAAMQAKQAEVLEKWFASARKNVFIEIKDPDCREVLYNWIQ